MIQPSQIYTPFRRRGLGSLDINISFLLQIIKTTIRFDYFQSEIIASNWRFNKFYYISFFLVDGLRGAPNSTVPYTLYSTVVAVP